MTRIVLLLLGVLALTLPAQTALVKIQTTAPVQVEALEQLELDLVDLPGGLFDVYIHTPQQMARLVQSGLPFELVHADVQAFYRSRLSQPLRSPIAGSAPTFGQGSMGGYFTFSEMVAFMDDLVSRFPNLIAPKVSLGQSLEGRDIWMWKVSDNPLIDENEPEVLIDAVHHAREPMSMMSTLFLAQRFCEDYGTDESITGLVDEREVFLVPMVNPDGYVYNQQTNPQGGGLWRKNRRVNSGGSRGVDLNRNYGFQWGLPGGSSGTPSSETYRGTAAFSEPETQVMKAFAESRNLTSGMTNHTYGQLFFTPPGYQNNAFPPEPLRSQYAAFAQTASTLGEGYTAGIPWQILYEASGTTEDWWYGDLYGGQVVWAFGSEIGQQSDGFWPSTSRIVPIATATFEMLEFVVRISGGALSVTGTTVTDVGGGQAGVWEPGETLEIVANVVNEGVDLAQTTLRIETSDANVMVPAPLSLGAVAPHGGTADNAASPLMVGLDMNAAPGTTVSFDLVVEAPGSPTTRVTFSRPLSLGPVTAFTDDAESNLGWTVGAPGDTAVAGIWTRADPNGSSNGGQPFNPEDDHTPAPGTDCWFTGQASPGSSVGSQDVDGTTTLTSPVFDLTNVHDPIISYWRWLTTSGNDTLDVEVSNDGGATWRLVETVTGVHPQWSPVSYRVEDILPRTDRMRMRFRAADDPNDSLLEVALDDFDIGGLDAIVDFSTTGSAALGTTLQLDVDAPLVPGGIYGIGGSLTVDVGIDVPGYGRYPHDIDDLFNAIPMFPTVFVDFVGSLDGSGQGTGQFHIPSIPSLTGITTWFSAIVLDGPQLSGLSGAVQVVFQ